MHPLPTWYVTRHTSHVTRHTSHVTRHTSHVTRHRLCAHVAAAVFDQLRGKTGGTQHIRRRLRQAGHVTLSDRTQMNRTTPSDRTQMNRTAPSDRTQMNRTLLHGKCSSPARHSCAPTFIFSSRAGASAARACDTRLQEEEGGVGLLQEAVEGESDVACERKCYKNEVRTQQAQVLQKCTAHTASASALPAACSNATRAAPSSNPMLCSDSTPAAEASKGKLLSACATLAWLSPNAASTADAQARGQPAATSRSWGEG